MPKGHYTPLGRSKPIGVSRKAEPLFSKVEIIKFAVHVASRESVNNTNTGLGIAPVYDTGELNLSGL
jgi:hypothetical protein